jgi:hypothetical protein
MDYEKIKKNYQNNYVTKTEKKMGILKLNDQIDNTINDNELI